MSDYLNVISLGAGKQSTYMLIQALEGNFTEKPDYAVFSDLGCEPQKVYEYVQWLRFYVKDKYDFEITTVSAGNLMQDMLDFVQGKTKRCGNIPLRLSTGGIIKRHCTYDYKIAPIRKFLQEIRKGRKVRLWIGISLDEIERMKTSNVKYIENYYPLIEKRISIDNIKYWYLKTGFKEPMKSACLICPFHSDSYWQRFKILFPNEFEKACQFDEAIRNYPNLKHKAYLSKHLKPLRDINFEYENSLFPELIEECEGLCGL